MKFIYSEDIDYAINIDHVLYFSCDYENATTTTVWARMSDGQGVPILQCPREDAKAEIKKIVDRLEGNDE